MKYKNIIFDFGNVIAAFDETHILSQFCGNAKDRPLLSSAIFDDWRGIDAGTTDYDAYAALAVSKLPEHLTKAAADFFNNWYRFLTPIPQTWNFIRELKQQGYSLYILSNAPVIFAEHADFYSITKEFDGIVFSAPIRMAKPDSSIYHYLFDTYHLHPEECFFLDDREENIRAAKALGMNGIIFTGDINAVKHAIGMR